MSRIRNAAVLVLALGALALAGTEATFYTFQDEYGTGRVQYDGSEYSKHNSELLVDFISGNVSWNAWLKFDLAGLPAGAVVEEAYVYYHAFQVTDPHPPNYVKALAHDPVTADAAQIWQDLVNGPIVGNDVPHGTGWVERRLDSNGRQAVEDAIEQGWVAFGLYKYDDSRTRMTARGYQGPFAPYLRIVYGIPPAEQPDMAVIRIEAPAGRLESGSAVVPAVVVRNLGDVRVPFEVTVTVQDAMPDIVYQETVSLDGVDVGGEFEVLFPGITLAGRQGDWVAVARVTAPGDVNQENDEHVNWFEVVSSPKGYLDFGWEEVTRLPLGPSGQYVRRGGWLAVNEADGLVYAAKGNKTGEFYAFNPVTDRWTELASIPYEQHPLWSNKPPREGARGVSDNRNYLYVLQGNKSLGFWRYDVAANGWDVLADVPEGEARQRVGGGSDMVYVDIDGKGYVYLLKGRAGEFFRYDVAAGSWQELPAPPAGVRQRWDKGSWLVSDGLGTIYAHKSRYFVGAVSPQHELWLYDVRAGSWEPVSRIGMPAFGRHGPRIARKKSKDGSGAGWFDGNIWSLKGGNSQQYFRYDPLRNGWRESDTLPTFGSSNARRRVKDGGDFVSYPRARAFYALKGNKTLEFWRYRLAPDGWVPGGVQALDRRDGRVQFAVGPNPVVGRSARVNWSLAPNTAKRVLVLDAAGRVVGRQTLGSERSGEARLSLDGLSAGVYLVSLEGIDGTTRKLVIQK